MLHWTMTLYALRTEGCPCIVHDTCTIIPSESRSLLGLESYFVWLLWAYVSRALTFSFSLSSATRATSPSVCESKVVASLKLVMQGLQTLPFCWTVLTGFVRPTWKWSHPELFVLSLMVKILLPVARQLAYSWLHCFMIDDTVDVFWLVYSEPSLNGHSL